MIIRLNVGGTLFDTTHKTMSACSNIDWCEVGAPTNKVPAYFFDYDPVVFARTLKVLRGYPCLDIVHDTEVLHQLTKLGHRFLEIELPEWTSSRSLTTGGLTIHTLDPEQTITYGENHTLLTSSSVTRLYELKVLFQAEYPDCKALGVRDGWVDSKWVPTWEYDLMRTKLKFLIYFCRDIVSEHLKK